LISKELHGHVSSFSPILYLNCAKTVPKPRQLGWAVPKPIPLSLAWRFSLTSASRFI